MRKRIILLLSLVCCLFLFVGCGDSDAQETTSKDESSEKQTTDLSLEYNKVSVWIGGKEYFTTDADSIALISQLLKAVTIDDKYTDGAEGGYDISLYKDNEIVSRMGLTDKRVIIDGKYVKFIENDTYETIKNMLVELQK